MKEQYLTEWCRANRYDGRKARRLLRKSIFKKIGGRWVATESILTFLSGDHK
jgi:hypothetical protein